MDMAENDTKSQNGESTQATEATAGVPRRMTNLSLAVLPQSEPTAAELDARQAAIGTSRKSGPPLPAGQISAAEVAFEVTEQQKPTEVAEPRKRDQ